MKVLIAVLCLLVAGIQSKAETSEKKYEKTYPNRHMALIWNPPSGTRTRAECGRTPPDIL